MLDPKRVQILKSQDNYKQLIQNPSKAKTREKEI